MVSILEKKKVSEGKYGCICAESVYPTAVREEKLHKS